MGSSFSSASWKRAPACQSSSCHCYSFKKEPLIQPKPSNSPSDNWQPSPAAKGGLQWFLNIVSAPSDVCRHQTKTYSNSLGERTTELELLQFPSWLEAAPGAQTQNLNIAKRIRLMPFPGLVLWGCFCFGLVFLMTLLEIPSL